MVLSEIVNFVASVGNAVGLIEVAVVVVVELVVSTAAVVAVESSGILVAEYKRVQ